ncbi:MAG: pilus assembly protein [Clostridiales bacterium]|nr:pilus assembly protein [Clostridiales bacterium]
MTRTHARKSAPSQKRADFRAALEQGNVTESVLIFPLVLTIIFLIIQVGLWAHATSIAQHSAQEAATQAATYKSTASGSEVANETLARNAGGVFHSYSASTSKSNTSVSVTVRGYALSLVPFTELPAIERTVTVPIEDYVQ